MNGIIADIKGRRAVLLTENNDYLTIKNKGYSIGQKINYKPTSYTGFTVLAASVILCLFTGFGGMKLYYHPVSYIDIDINPSMRIGINTFERVIEFTPLNDDAQTLIDSIGKLTGSVDKCIKEIVEASENLGYINNSNQDVTVEVVSGSRKFYDKTEHFCRDIAENDSNVTINVYQADKDTLAKAKELGVSVGKLRLLDEYKNAGGENADSSNIKDKTNAELTQLIEDTKSTKTQLTPGNTPASPASTDSVSEETKKNEKTAKQASGAEKRTEQPPKEAAALAEKAEIISEKSGADTKKQTEQPEKIYEKEAEIINTEAASQSEQAEMPAGKADSKSENPREQTEKDFEKDKDNAEDQREHTEKESEKDKDNAEKQKEQAEKDFEKPNAGTEYPWEQAEKDFEKDKEAEKQNELVEKDFEKDKEDKENTENQSEQAEKEIVNANSGADKPKEQAEKENPKPNAGADKQKEQAEKENSKPNSEADKPKEQAEKAEKEAEKHREQPEKPAQKASEKQTAKDNSGNEKNN